MSLGRLQLPGSHPSPRLLFQRTSKGTTIIQTDGLAAIDGDSARISQGHPPAGAWMSISEPGLHLRTLKESITLNANESVVNAHT